jgi:ABC-type multidrug transport system fused ATPase/permease subunit
LDYVIKGIKFSINNNEKVGVVGRTGSGKSTLTLGLLRILELAEKDGSKGTLSIDSIDTAKVGLHYLRKKVTIIPQDPTLFSGTVRTNVDPFKEYGDEAIIEALKRVKLWDKLKAEEDKEEDFVEEQIKKVKGIKTKKPKTPKEIEMTTISESQLKLQMKITEKGSNLSQGERQLLCMGRAILRNSKILLMDEATASIDEMTDNLLQQMIKKDMKETTVFTIAHRLNTIIQYDRIIVMDQGEIKEFDTPLNLLNKQDGLLAGMVKQSGEEIASKLRYLAEHKEIDIGDAKDVKNINIE